jgi:mannose-6-phosphate isomerase-like protein (cupin superfamily)
MKRLAPVLVALAACGHHPGTSKPTPAEIDAAPEETASDEERTAAIEQAMNTLDPVAHQCWAAAATDDYQLAGDIGVLVSVDGAGKGTTEAHGDTANDPVLTRCLLSVVAAYEWPKPMHGASTLLQFSFTAPHEQNVIDRAFVPEVDDGARVLMDKRNTGNGALSMFELTVPAGKKLSATKSSRVEIWLYLDDPGAGSVPAAKALDVMYLAKGAPRAPVASDGAPLHILVVACPGGTEDATRQSGVLPAGPAKVSDKPAAVVGVPKKAPMTAAVVDLATDDDTHATAAEMLYVLSGSGTFVIDGVSLPITATSVVQIPAGVAHSYTPSVPTKAIQLFSPPP